MAVKQERHTVRGMQKDLDVSKFRAEFVLDAQNIRITARDNDTLLSVTNEKGNKEVVTPSKDKITLKGVCLGYGVLNNYLVVFTKGITDNIYRLEKKKDGFEIVQLYGDKPNHGSLKFDTKHPIETLCVYENERIQKVYWVDGLNQPRLINIVADSEITDKYDSTFFDFIGSLSLQEDVTINRNLVASGSFPPGVLQYALTYYNKFGQESNIFYTSQLFYTSYNNRGAAPDDKVSNSFTIRVENPDTKYDFMRIYSIMRTSINATPTVKNVADLRPSMKKEMFLKTSREEYGYDLKVNSLFDTFIYDNHNGTSQRLGKFPLVVDLSKPGKIVYTYTFLNPEGIYIWNEYTNEAIELDKYSKYTMTIVASSTQYNVIESSTISGTVKVGEPDYTTKYYIEYTDSGLSGSIVDPTELLYKGGEAISCSTFTQKDNTLFLGNIDIKRKPISAEIKSKLKDGSVQFESSKLIDVPIATGYYPYKNSLTSDSYNIKTFKYLEWYRLGLQFQYYTGKWSEPVWIGDYQNNAHVEGNFFASSLSSDNIYLPEAHYVLNDGDIIAELKKEGYIKVRPVIVYPTINDRECICQGILCPTVYNVGDRFSNSPFVQSSWFARPNAPFDIIKSFNYTGEVSSEDYLADTSELGSAGEPSLISRAGLLSAGRFTVNYSFNNGPVKQFNFDSSNFGDWSEFRHNYPIPDNKYRNAEIQCVHKPDGIPVVFPDDTGTDYVNKYQENFYIDQSIITMHSPDIEFDNDVRSLDSSNLKLRIVGMVPMTSFFGDVDIQTSTPTIPYKGTSNSPRGFYKEKIGAETTFISVLPGIAGRPKEKTEANFGYRGLNAGVLWFDEVYGAEYESNPTNKTTGYAIYPWHRNGSLNNQGATTEKRSAMLSQKKMSNIRYSFGNTYFDTYKIWKAYDTSKKENIVTHTGISGVNIFDGEKSALVKIKAPENSGLPEINYYGDVDKVVVGNYIPGKEPYPIMMGGRIEDNESNIHTLFSTPEFMQVTQTSSNTSTDPVRITYKSTPHAVIALNYTKDNKQRILPTIYDSDSSYKPVTRWSVNDSNMELKKLLVPMKFFWDSKNMISGVSQDTLVSNSGDSDIEALGYGWFWLGELYNDSVNNRFGGTTEEALTNNTWVPCGKAINIDSNKAVTIIWSDGDTYYQRYDHLKTYPKTMSDQNSVVDIVSFMCETHVNLDGRYDRNRGNTSNLVIHPEIFNKINPIYSQVNNFFNYRILDEDRFNINKFPNTVTWTKEKHAGELIDTWTNITMANTMDMDGDKGEITSLNIFNNELFCFQQRGIGNIMFNSRVQISPSDGVPIELSSGGKVQGRRYISDDVGCSNKWSISESPLGLYFIDNEVGAIYVYNGKLTPLSNTLGFKQWLEENNSYDMWNPVDFNNFITFYDKSHGDVYFVNNDTCLCYSEFLNQFTSFMSYERTPAMFNIGNEFYSIRDNKLWENFEGDFNVFYCPDGDNWEDYYKPFNLTFISNQDMPLDKIFNTVEFKADSVDKEGKLLPHTFDTLETWNEYQHGKIELNNVFGYPSPLKEKYRTWRANIPRNEGTMDRMRNPWLKLKLSKDTPNKDMTTLHDFAVNYFV